MTDDRTAESAEQRFDSDAISRIILTAAQKKEARAVTLSRADLDAIGHEVGLTPADIDAGIQSEMHAPVPAASEGATPQVPVIAGGLALGIVAAGVVGVVAAGASPDAGTMAALTAITAMVGVEAVVARKLKGRYRLATFHAANIATWGAWTVTSVALAITAPSDIGIIASLAAAVAGTALIMGKRRIRVDTLSVAKVAEAAEAAEAAE